MCCSGFLKIMMFVFNGGIFLAGAAILGVGVWVKVDSKSLLGLLESVEDAPSGLSELVYVSYLLIAVGAVLLIIGFLGCCGAVRESRCMLLTFFSIVLIIFLIEVAGAVVLLVFKDVVSLCRKPNRIKLVIYASVNMLHLKKDLKNSAKQVLMDVEDKVRNDIQTHYGKGESLTSLWNATMDQFKCCGYKNYTDFDGSPFYNENGNVYPPTCCNATITTGVCNTKGASISMMDGCFDKLLQFIEDNTVIIAGVALGIAALEIAAMVVSMVLYNKIGNKRS
ncbi:tetraspanin-1-like [Tautogolabrus adspersus]